MDAITPTATKNAMNIMDPTGHTRVEWDPAITAEVTMARENFERMTGQGYSAFSTDEEGNQGRRLTAFEPAARSMILVPQLRGG